MSTDFTTGNNKKITSESTYLVLSDKLGKLFKDKNIDLDRNFFFDKFAKNKLFSKTLNDEDSRWKLLARYRNSNNYTSNKFDDVIILNSVNNKEQFLSLSDETIDSRKSLINSYCSSYIKDGYCSDFSNQLTGFFPHLDKPGDIISMVSTSGGIPCFEFGYGTIYANITYEDSCGQNVLQPVPTYKDYSYNKTTDEIDEDKWSYNTLNDIAPEYATFKWEVLENSVDIMIKDNVVNRNIVEIATLSSASNDQIKLSLTYAEGIVQ